MTQDEIIKLVEANGLTLQGDIEHFAELVAQHEREAIAQMVEDAPPLMEFAQNHQGGCLMCGFTPKQAAEIIRARGQT